MAHDTGWTAERIATLRREWGGSMSAGEIGEALAMSKSAVIGKARRLGLKALAPLRPRKVAEPKPVTKARPRPPRHRPALVLVSRGGLPLAELTTTQCRFPLDGDIDNTATRFCARTVVDAPNGERSSWCVEHYRRCHKRIGEDEIKDPAASAA